MSIGPVGMNSYGMARQNVSFGASPQGKAAKVVNTALTEARARKFDTFGGKGIDPREIKGFFSMFKSEAREPLSVYDGSVNLA